TPAARVIPLPARALLRRVLAKEREGRPATAGALAEELEAIAEARSRQHDPTAILPVITVPPPQAQVPPAPVPPLPAPSATPLVELARRTPVALPASPARPRPAVAGTPSAPSSRRPLMLALGALLLVAVSAGIVLLLARREEPAPPPPPTIVAAPPA